MKTACRSLLPVTATRFVGLHAALPFLLAFLVFGVSTTAQAELTCEFDLVYDDSAMKYVEDTSAVVCYPPALTQGEDYDYRLGGTQNWPGVTDQLYYDADKFKEGMEITFAHKWSNVCEFPWKPETEVVRVCGATGCYNQTVSNIKRRTYVHDDVFTIKLTSQSGNDYWGYFYDGKVTGETGSSVELSSWSFFGIYGRIVRTKKRPLYSGECGTGQVDLWDIEATGGLTDSTYSASHDARNAEKIEAPSPPDVDDSLDYSISLDRKIDKEVYVGSTIQFTSIDQIVSKIGSAGLQHDIIVYIEPGYEVSATNLTGLKLNGHTLLITTGAHPSYQILPSEKKGFIKSINASPKGPGDLIISGVKIGKSSQDHGVYVGAAANVITTIHKVEFANSPKGVVVDTDGCGDVRISESDFYNSNRGVKIKSAAVVNISKSKFSGADICVQDTNGLSATAPQIASSAFIGCNTAVELNPSVSTSSSCTIAPSRSELLKNVFKNNGKGILQQREFPSNIVANSFFRKNRDSWDVKLTGPKSSIPALTEKMEGAFVTLRENNPLGRVKIENVRTRVYSNWLSHIEAEPNGARIEVIGNTFCNSCTLPSDGGSIIKEPELRLTGNAEKPSVFIENSLVIRGREHQEDTPVLWINRHELIAYGGEMLVSIPNGENAAEVVFAYVDKSYKKNGNWKSEDFYRDDYRQLVADFMGGVDSNTLFQLEAYLIPNKDGSFILDLASLRSKDFNRLNELFIAHDGMLTVKAVGGPSSGYLIPTASVLGCSTMTVKCPIEYTRYKKLIGAYVSLNFPTDLISDLDVADNKILLVYIGGWGGASYEAAGFTKAFQEAAFYYARKAFESTEIQIHITTWQREHIPVDTSNAHKQEYAIRGYGGLNTTENAIRWLCYWLEERQQLKYLGDDSLYNLVVVGQSAGGTIPAAAMGYIPEFKHLSCPQLFEESQGENGLRHAGVTIDTPLLSSLVGTAVDFGYLLPSPFRIKAEILDVLGIDNPLSEGFDVLKAARDYTVVLNEGALPKNYYDLRLPTHMPFTPSDTYDGEKAVEGRLLNQMMARAVAYYIITGTYLDPMTPLTTEEIELFKDME